MKHSTPPLRDRAIKTYSIVILFGVANELVGTVVASWYQFTPWWIVFGVIIFVYGGILGSIILLSAGLRAPVQFLLGSAIGFSAETINHLTGELFWHFDRLQPVDGWVVSALLYGGIPAGILVVLVNWIVRLLYRHRLQVA